MAEYKKDDKVVIIGTVTRSEDEFGNLDIDLPNGDYPRRTLKTSEVTHLEDFTPAEEKIKMTVEEKREFDKLKKVHKSLFLAFSDIYDDEYPNLFGRLFDNDDVEKSCKAQLEFARAWDKPSKIEVIVPKKYNIKLNTHIPLLSDMYLYRPLNTNGDLSLAFAGKEYNLDEDQQWTERQAKKYGLKYSNPSFLFEEVSE